MTTNARRERFLRAMGIAPLWRLRSVSDGPEEESAASSSETVASEQVSATEPEKGQVPENAIGEARIAAARPPDVARATAPAPTEPAAGRAKRSFPEPGFTQVGPLDGLDWEELEAAISSCRACRLCESRRRAVPGTGDRKARLMFVGEGPGAEEDRRGLPFVGAAGELLDAMLAAIGKDRKHDVYIANTVKCRPPLNRTPQDDEIAACAAYLERQIELVEPDLIVALGRPAAQRLLGEPVRINSARGKTWAYGESTPVIVTYHPAYLLRNPQDKAKAWSDLCLIRQVLDS